MEEWEGPGEKVDLILLSHVVYYIKDVKSLFSKMLSWLQPKGNFFILTLEKSKAEFTIGKIAKKI